MPLLFIYTLIFYVCTPFILLRLLWRSRDNRAYRQNLLQRFGFFKIPTEYQKGLWIHTVSLGEVIAATPLIKAIAKQHPSLPITLTTMTVTGSQYVKTHFAGQVFHVFVPYDLPLAIRNFLSRVQPRVLLLLETELWPNMLKACQRQHIPVMLSNARLSEKSAKGYRHIAKVTRNMLSAVNVIAAHAETDAERFIQLGARASDVTVAGSIKFDMSTPASVFEQTPALRSLLGEGRPVWIAASTHQGEEEKILDVFHEVLKALPTTLLLLVPRHPERFSRVIQDCKRAGYEVVTSTSQSACAPTTQIFVGDTMGQLKLFYAVSDVAFVGGSLMPIGGHNVLEPLSLGIPTIVGPHMFNFEDMTVLLLKEEILLQIETTEALAADVIHLLEDSPRRADFAMKAEKVLAKNKGAVEKNLRLLETLLK